MTDPQLAGEQVHEPPRDGEAHQRNGVEGRHDVATQRVDQPRHQHSHAVGRSIGLVGSLASRRYSPASQQTGCWTSGLTTNQKLMSTTESTAACTASIAVMALASRSATLVSTASLGERTKRRNSVNAAHLASVSAGPSVVAVGRSFSAHDSCGRHDIGQAR